MSELEGAREAFRRARQDGDLIIQNACATVGRFVEEVEATRWPHLDAWRQQFVHLEVERDSALGELALLRESLNSLVDDRPLSNGDRRTDPMGPDAISERMAPAPLE